MSKQTSQPLKETRVMRDAQTILQECSQTLFFDKLTLEVRLDIRDILNEIRCYLASITKTLQQQQQQCKQQPKEAD
jgi:hypothetical protein